MLALIDDGFSLGQIIDWLTDPAIKIAMAPYSEPGRGRCVRLWQLGRDGIEYIEPADATATCGLLNADDSGEAEPSEPEADVAVDEADATDEPDDGTATRIYVGTATVDLTFPGTGTFTGTKCVIHPDVELTLGPITPDTESGPATLVVTWTNFIATPPQPEGEGCQILDTVYDFPTVGTWSGNEFTATVLLPGRGAETEVSGLLSEGSATMNADLKWPERSEKGTIIFELDLVQN